MNYFRNNKFTFWVLIILILLNIFSLSALFIKQEKIADPLRDGNLPGIKPLPFDRIEHFMKKEIGLSDAQIDSFRITREKHMKAMQHLNMEIHKRKKQLMDGAFDDSMDEEKSKVLLQEIGEYQHEIEEISLKHLLEMSRICEPNQKERLKHLLEEAMVKHRPDFQGREMRPDDRPPQNNKHLRHRR